MVKYLTPKKPTADPAQILNLTLLGLQSAIASLSANPTAANVKALCEVARTIILMRKDERDADKISTLVESLANMSAEELKKVANEALDELAA